MKPKKPTITIDTSTSGLKILFNGLPHIYIADKSDLIGFQGYVQGGNNYCIEFYTKHRSFTATYNSYEKWEKVLQLLNQL
jgi:hypothetical protein